MTANTVAEIFASRREQHRRTVPLCYRADRRRVDRDELRAILDKLDE